MPPAKRIYIAGHTGLVGSALVRLLSQDPQVTVLTAERSQVDLTRQEAVENLLKALRPEAVILSAGRVGGIQANSDLPASFLYENLLMEANVIHAAWQAGVKQLINFGSSCMYPKSARQPMRPKDLGTGALESTSEPYAVAKLAGLALCQAYNRQHGTRFVTVIPATVYGVNDHFHLETSHVLSALLARFHEAKRAGAGEVTLWGTGRPRREFLFSDDLARALALILERYEGSEPVNVGSGEVVSIAELAGRIAQTVGFEGKIRWDSNRPDGALEKSLDSSFVLGLGFIPQTPLASGLQKTYDWFLKRETDLVSPGVMR